MLQGSLDDFALHEVLGLLSSSTKTGKLDLKGNRGNGIIRFHQGRLVQASTSNTVNGTSSEDVLFELLRYHDGTFSFAASESENGDPQDVRTVLAAAEERLVEWQTIESVVPSLRHVVTPVPELPSAEVTISRQEWATLTVIADGCPVSTVCDELALGEFEGSRQIKHLVERDLVQVAPPRSSSSSMRRSSADTPSGSTSGTANPSTQRRGTEELIQESKARIAASDRAIAASAAEPAAPGRETQGLVDEIVGVSPSSPKPPPHPAATASPESGTAQVPPNPPAALIKTETIGSDDGDERDDKGTGLLMRYLKSEN